VYDRCSTVYVHVISTVNWVLFLLNIKGWKQFQLVTFIIFDLQYDRLELALLMTSTYTIILIYVCVCECECVKQPWWWFYNLSHETMRIVLNWIGLFSANFWDDSSRSRLEKKIECLDLVSYSDMKVLLTTLQLPKGTYHSLNRLRYTQGIGDKHISSTVNLSQT
jgi:hypothetical protein